MYGGSWRPKTRTHTPYDGTGPVILLHPEDMRARPDHQLLMSIYIIIYMCNATIYLYTYRYYK